MTQQTRTYTFSKDNPDLIREAADYFLSQYKELREWLLARKTPVIDTCETKIFILAALCVEKFPKDAITDAGFKYLLELFYTIRGMLNEIPPKNDSPFIAGFWLTHRAMINYADLFICMTLCLLVFDKRYNPNQNLVFNKHDYPELPFYENTSRYLDLESLAPNHYKHLCTAAQSAKLTELLEEDHNFHELFGGTFQILQMASRLFFNLMQSRYSLTEINACSAAFDAVMIKFESGDIKAECEFYRQKWNDMYAAICRFEEHGGVGNIDASKLDQILSYAQKTHAQVLALSERQPNAIPNRKKRRSDHGGKGKQTTTMQEQLSAFKAWMIDKKKPKGIGKARAYATQYWHLDEGMEEAKNAEDQKKGYEDPNCLAQAYMWSIKKPPKPRLT